MTSPETPTMTAEDAAFLSLGTGRKYTWHMGRALRDRILATYHALAAAEKGWLEASAALADYEVVKEMLAAAREDSARLDWLERRGRVTSLMFSWDALEDADAALRQALDAARSTDAARRGTE